jgi:hypothetical protein
LGLPDTKNLSALVWSAALDAVEGALTGVLQNPESFLIGAELVGLDIEFKKQAVFREYRPAWRLWKIAGGVLGVILADEFS